MRVLVCGGRDYSDAETVFRTLAAIHVATPVTTIVQGGATGADRLAQRWAESTLVTCEIYLADWVKEGKAAGPKRNARMLAEGKPDLVVAFAGGRGTEDMKRKARAVGVEVREVLP